MSASGLRRSKWSRVSNASPTSANAVGTSTSRRPASGASAGAAAARTPRRSAGSTAGQRALRMSPACQLCPAATARYQLSRQRAQRQPGAEEDPHPVGAPAARPNTTPTARAAAGRRPDRRGSWRRRRSPSTAVARIGPNSAAAASALAPRPAIAPSSHGPGVGRAARARRAGRSRRSSSGRREPAGVGERGVRRLRQPRERHLPVDVGRRPRDESGGDDPHASRSSRTATTRPRTRAPRR